MLSNIDTDENIIFYKELLEKDKEIINIEKTIIKSLFKSIIDIYKILYKDLDIYLLNKYSNMYIITEIHNNILYIYLYDKYKDITFNHSINLSVLNDNFLNNLQNNYINYDKLIYYIFYNLNNKFINYELNIIDDNSIELNINEIDFNYFKQNEKISFIFKKVNKNIIFFSDDIDIINKDTIIFNSINNLTNFYNNKDYLYKLIHKDIYKYKTNGIFSCKTGKNKEVYLYDSHFEKIKFNITFKSDNLCPFILYKTKLDKYPKYLYTYKYIYTDIDKYININFINLENNKNYSLNFECNYLNKEMLNCLLLNKFYVEFLFSKLNNIDYNINENEDNIELIFNKIDLNICVISPIKFVFNEFKKNNTNHEDRFIIIGKYKKDEIKENVIIDEVIIDDVKKEVIIDDIKEIKEVINDGVEEFKEEIKEEINDSGVEEFKEAINDGVEEFKDEIKDEIKKEIINYGGVEEFKEAINDGGVEEFKDEIKDEKIINEIINYEGIEEFKEEIKEIINSEDFKTGPEYEFKTVQEIMDENEKKNIDKIKELKTELEYKKILLKLLLKEN